MADRPDGSCINGIYQMGRADADGHGEPDDNTPRAPQPEPAIAEQDEIDEDDAECMDCLIAQIAQAHRIVLNRVYVLRGRKGSPKLLEAAVEAVAGVMQANRAVVERMRGKV